MNICKDHNGTAHKYIFFSDDVDDDDDNDGLLDNEDDDDDGDGIPDDEVRGFADLLI